MTSGNKVLAWVTIIINALVLVSNALLDIYRKWRDRDSDKKVKNMKSDHDSSNENEHTDK